MTEPVRSLATRYDTDVQAYKLEAVVDPCGGVNSKQFVMHLQCWIREAIDA
jgi:hypothetical protein